MNEYLYQGAVYQIEERHADGRVTITRLRGRASAGTPERLTVDGADVKPAPWNTKA